MMKLVYFIIVTFCFMVPIQNSHAMTPSSLIYMTEQLPPYNYIEDNELKGYSVELLKLIWQEMGIEEQEILLLPWARGYSDLLRKENAVLFVTSKTKERTDLFKWVGPIIEPKKVVIFTRHDNLKKINSLQDIIEEKVGVIRGDISERYLLKAGFKDESLIKTNTLDSLMKMLHYGRMDYVIHYLDVINNFINISPEHNAKNFVVSYTLNTKEEDQGAAYAFNKNVPDELINLFKEAYARVKKEDIERLKNKYFPE